MLCNTRIGPQRDRHVGRQHKKDRREKSMQQKAPRRTRERILELSLRLFNEFGEPNITTTVIAEEMNISPGNLYYHFRNKDDIVNSIFAQFEGEIGRMLAVPADRRPNIEDVWLYLHLMFELVWRYRFFYRDLSDLLSRNRKLELQFKQILAHKIKVAQQLCEGLRSDSAMQATDLEINALSTNMVVVATYWLSYEYVLNPRKYTEQQAIADALARGCYQVLSLIGPYLCGETQLLFGKLAEEYLKKIRRT
jgi:AcrR family transcriptional regulator